LINIRILYWKEIPVQIEFTKDKIKKSAQLDEKFQIAVDSIAMKDGSYGSDDYLDSWEWVDKDKVDKILDEEFINKYISLYKFPNDFIKKINKDIDNGNRSGLPGSIDDWLMNR